MAEIINIFNFLKEFNELSNPVISEIGNQKWSLSIADIPVIDEIRSVFLGHELGEMDYLEIKRPTLLPCPNPPESLIEWIKNDWKKTTVENVEIADKLPRKSLDESGDLVYTEELFVDDQARVDAYNLWNAERKNWRGIEAPKSKGLDLYNRLFQLYSEMKLESESVELMLGDGNIRWYTEDRVIDHPVLLQKVFLHFDSHIPSFRVSCEEKKSELYTPMLRVISSINQKMLSDIIVEIEDGDFDLAHTENTEGIYKRIINVIDNKGEFVGAPRGINETATIHTAPVLFLRKRTLGFSSFIESVIDDVQTNVKNGLPGFFEIMSGVYKEKEQEDIVEKSWNHSGIDEDVLLTLPANNEQLRIIKYLERYGAVLVQGPPGTGKTHTIANLIGHLLSQGNSVLVTSHTEKALTVLKEKVYKDPYDPEVNLQNLCISILSSTSQKKEMDEAINEIASKSSSLDLHSSHSKISRLKAERKELVNASKVMTMDLVRARSAEYKDLIFDNHTIAPIDAAKFLNSGTGTFDYITGKSNDDEIGIPMTQEELVYLYASNAKMSGEEEELLKKDYPCSEDILCSADFATIVDRMQEMRGILSGSNLTESTIVTIPIEMIREMLDEANQLIAMISGFDAMERALSNRTISDPTYPKLWDDVLERTGDILEKHEAYRKLKLNHDFEIDNKVLNKTALQTIQAIIESGKEKPIGFLAKGDWKRIRDAIKLNGKAIELISEFMDAYELISYEVEKQDVIKLVDKLLADIMEVEGSAFNDFENKIRRYKAQIVSALGWYRGTCTSYFAKVEESVQWNAERGLPRITSINSLNDVSSYLQVVCNLFETKIVESELVELTNQVDAYKKHLTGFADANPLVEAILRAIGSQDKESYSDHLKALNTVIDKVEIAEKRSELISRIRCVAPNLAMQIENREGLHSLSSVPEYFEDAWKHFQLRNQIERLDGLDPAKIQDDIEMVNTQLLKNARMLALEKAWHEKVKNQTDKQNQALQGWRNTVKQIGKGTGKNAPMLRAKARELMPLCQTAIPVWIMPLSRVVETFDPRNNKFDVIIIDEASQANILSLAALYLAKKVIIVGDDEQVSPDVFGVKSDEVNALVAQHLERIPNNHLYNGLTSLYDMAKSSGFKPLMLTEHFRCLPEIIGFSNELSYNGRIKPLRDSSDTPVYPSVVEYRVSDAFRNSKKVNEAEVEHIVSIIQAFIEMDEYRGQTIGVISMLGNEQSAAIEKKLQSIIDPTEYEERRIQCGTPPQFQGDERDIIILSLVDSPNEGGGPLRLLSEDGNNDKYRKRYNVAVSRARNQLWVVHSLNPEIDLKQDDLRLKLIKYAMNPSRDQDGLLAMSESPFEMEVMKCLLAAGYKIIPQFKVGAYRIDMVVQSGDKKVALECDGERFHTVENLDSDLARQAILERLGWRFVRIRGSVYYRDPEQTMEDVKESLTKYGILPTFEDEGSDKPANNELVNVVKMKARAFRNGLVNTDDGSTIPEDVEAMPETADGSVSVEKETPDIRTEEEPKKIDVPLEEPVLDTPMVASQRRTADAPYTVTNQIDSNVKVDRDPAGKSTVPAFDFRGKQQSVKEKAKAVEVKPAENTGVGKPKFDFRKGKE